MAFSIAPGFVNTNMAKSFIEKNGEDLIKKGIQLNQLTEPKDISPVVGLIVSGRMDPFRIPVNVREKNQKYKFQKIT